MHNTYIGNFPEIKLNCEKKIKDKFLKNDKRKMIYVVKNYLVWMYLKRCTTSEHTDYLY